MDLQRVEARGASGYFSRPADELDPHLFVGDALRPNVRTSLLRLLYGHWLGVYEDPESWSTVWIAGSGASYQWGADREATGPGDLDVLIGVNIVRFLQTNPDFRGIPEAQIAARINQELHDRLWPTTATYDFGGQKYEITFYVNPAAEDITEIAPYAAYNVSTDAWTVRPIELPADWGLQSLPAEWREKFDSDTNLGQTFISRYNDQVGQLAATAPATPRWVNLQVGLHGIVDQAVALFDEIHLGRKNSFSRGGPGYRGFENARWQYGKGTGIIDGLRQIKAAHHHAGLSNADTEASLWATPYRGI